MTTASTIHKFFEHKNVENANKGINSIQILPGGENDTLHSLYSCAQGGLRISSSMRSGSDQSIGMVDEHMKANEGYCMNILDAWFDQELILNLPSMNQGSSVPITHISSLSHTIECLPENPIQCTILSVVRLGKGVDLYMSVDSSPVHVFPITSFESTVMMPITSALYSTASPTFSEKTGNSTREWAVIWPVEVFIGVANKKVESYSLQIGFSLSVEQLTVEPDRKKAKIEQMNRAISSKNHLHITPQSFNCRRIGTRSFIGHHDCVRCCVVVDPNSISGYQTEEDTSVLVTGSDDGSLHIYPLFSTRDTDAKLSQLSLNMSIVKPRQTYSSAHSNDVLCCASSYCNNVTASTGSKQKKQAGSANRLPILDPGCIIVTGGKDGAVLFSQLCNFSTPIGQITFSFASVRCVDTCPIPPGYSRRRSSDIHVSHDPTTLAIVGLSNGTLGLVWLSQPMSGEGGPKSESKKRRDRERRKKRRIDDEDAASKEEVPRKGYLCTGPWEVDYESVVFDSSEPITALCVTSKVIDTSWILTAIVGYESGSLAALDIHL